MQEQGQVFGSRLHALRRQRGWSLREAARFIGLSFTRIGEYERGFDGHTGKPLVPPYRLVATMARVYGVPESELLRLAGYAASVDLSDEEIALLGRFRGLSADARGQLLAQADALADGKLPD